MNNALRERLIETARAVVTTDDPSHDINHVMRVMQMAEKLAAIEGGDLDIIIPGALFHDVVNHPKDDPRALHAADESAILARTLLEKISDYPHEKIAHVEEAIIDHSFTKGIIPKKIEAQIVQDADRLEATGAISIMRTFASSGQMKRPFYHPDDPFCERRDHETLDNVVKYGLDLFYKRLLKVGDMMNTKTAKKIAASRTEFLRTFLEQLKKELRGNE